MGQGAVRLRDYPPLDCGDHRENEASPRTRDACHDAKSQESWLQAERACPARRWVPSRRAQSHLGCSPKRITRLSGLYAARERAKEVSDEQEENKASGAWA